jgi:hypothetical protein
MINLISVNIIIKTRKPTKIKEDQIFRKGQIEVVKVAEK